MMNKELLKQSLEYIANKDFQASIAHSLLAIATKLNEDKNTIERPRSNLEYITYSSLKIQNPKTEEEKRYNEMLDMANSNQIQEEDDKWSQLEFDFGL